METGVGAMGAEEERDFQSLEDYGTMAQGPKEHAQGLEHQRQKQTTLEEAESVKSQGGREQGPAPSRHKQVVHI